MNAMNVVSTARRAESFLPIGGWAAGWVSLRRLELVIVVVVSGVIAICGVKLVAVAEAV